MARNTVGGIGVAPGAKLRGLIFRLSSQADSIFIDSLGGSTAAPKSDDVFIFNQSFGLSPATDISIDPAHEGQYASGTTSLRGGNRRPHVKAAGHRFFRITARLSFTTA